MSMIDVFTCFPVELSASAFFDEERDVEMMDVSDFVENEQIYSFGNMEDVEMVEEVTHVSASDMVMSSTEDYIQKKMIYSEDDYDMQAEVEEIRPSEVLKKTKLVRQGSALTNKDIIASGSFIKVSALDKYEEGKVLNWRMKTLNNPHEFLTYDDSAFNSLMDCEIKKDSFLEMLENGENDTEERLVYVAFDSSWVCNTEFKQIQSQGGMRDMLIKRKYIRKNEKVTIVFFDSIITTAETEYKIKKNDGRYDNIPLDFMTDYLDFVKSDDKEKYGFDMDVQVDRTLLCNALADIEKQMLNEQHNLKGLRNEVNDYVQLEVLAKYVKMTPRAKGIIFTKDRGQQNHCKANFKKNLKHTS